MLEHSLPGRVKAAVLMIEPSAEVILFGSRARNDFGIFSDWDFLVLVDGPVNTSRTDKVRAALYDVELDTGEIVNSIVRDKVSWNGPRYQFAPLHTNVEREGVRI